MSPASPTTTNSAMPEPTAVGAVEPPGEGATDKRILLPRILTGDAFAFSVPTHQAGWDGTVCTDAAFWPCGKSAQFRSEHCTGGGRGCMSAHAFAQSPKLRIGEPALLALLREDPNALAGRFLILFDGERGADPQNIPPLLQGIYLIDHLNVVSGPNDTSQVIVVPREGCWTRLPASFVSDRGLAFGVRPDSGRLHRVPREDVLELLRVGGTTRPGRSSRSTTDTALAAFFEAIRESKLAALASERYGSVPETLAALPTMRIVTEADLPYVSYEPAPRAAPEEEPERPTRQTLLVAAQQPRAPEDSVSPAAPAIALIRTAAIAATAPTPARQAADPEPATGEEPHGGRPVPERPVPSARAVADTPAGRPVLEPTPVSRRVRLLQAAQAEGIEFEDLEWADRLLRAGQLVLLLGRAADGTARAWASALCGGKLLELAPGPATLCIDDLFRDAPSGQPTALGRALAREPSTEDGQLRGLHLRAIDASAARLWLDPFHAWLASAERPDGLSVLATLSAFAEPGDLPRGIERYVTALEPRFVSNAAVQMVDARSSYQCPTAYSRTAMSPEAEALAKSALESLVIDEHDLDPARLAPIAALMRTIAADATREGKALSEAALVRLARSSMPAAEGDEPVLSVQNGYRRLLTLSGGTSSQESTA